MMSPEWLYRKRTESQAEIAFVLDPALFWFQGHFPVQPLLPGVAQLDWAIRHGLEMLAPSHRFQAVRSVKFQAPLLPGDHVLLSLDWLAESGVLSFQYRREAGAAASLASAGKIQLCR